MKWWPITSEKASVLRALAGGFSPWQRIIGQVFSLSRSAQIQVPSRTDTTRGAVVRVDRNDAAVPAGHGWQADSRGARLSRRPRQASVGRPPPRSPASVAAPTGP